MIYRYLEGFISLSQAAKVVGISRWGLQKAIYENRIDGYRVGECWILKTKDVDEFRFSRKRGTK